MLDNDLLENHMSTFLGFGNFQADIWFFGMEQGGGGSYEDISRRLKAWQNRGMRELEDVRDYHFAIGIDRFFREPVFLQRTWGHLIRVVLAMNNLPVDLPNIKAYQKKQFAREDGSTCIIELMPLPSPGLAKWFYPQWSNLSCLHTRDSYLRQVLPARIQLIQTKIGFHKPSFVLFYGLTYLQYFERVVGSKFRFKSEYGCYLHQEKDTIFLAMKHPVARGVDNLYFTKIGELLKILKSPDNSNSEKSM